MSDNNDKQRRRKRNSIPKRSDMAAYATDEYLANKKQERKIENGHTVFRQDKKATADISDRYSNKSSSFTLDGESKYKMHEKESLKPIYDKESIIHDNSEPHRSDVAGRYAKNSEAHDQSYAARNEHVVREERRTFGSQESSSHPSYSSSPSQPRTQERQVRPEQGYVVPKSTDDSSSYGTGGRTYDKDYASRNQRVVREERKTLGSQEPSSHLGYSSLPSQPRVQERQVNPEQGYVAPKGTDDSSSYGAGSRTYGQNYTARNEHIVREERRTFGSQESASHPSSSSSPSQPRMQDRQVRPEQRYSAPKNTDNNSSYGTGGRTYGQDYTARNEHIVREEKRTFGNSESASNLSDGSSSPQPHMYQDRNPAHFSTRYDESKITLTKKEQENFKRCASPALISATGYDEKSGRMDIEAYGALRRANGNNSFVEGVKLVENGERSFGDLCTTANRHTITLTPQEKKYYDNVFAQKQDVFRNTGYDQVNGTISLDAYAGIRNSGGNFKNGVDLVNEGIVTFSRPVMEESLRSCLRDNPVTSGERIILSPSERETFEKNISDASVIYKQCSYDPSSGTMDTGVYSALKNAGGAGGFSGAISQISEKKDFTLRITGNEKIRLTPTENYFFKSIDKSNPIYQSASYDNSERTVSKAAYAAIRNAGGTDASFMDGVKSVNNGELRFENGVYTGRFIDTHENTLPRSETIQLTMTEKRVFETQVSRNSPVYKRSGYDPSSGRMDIRAYSVIRRAGEEEGFLKGVHTIKNDIQVYDNLMYSSSSSLVNLSESERKTFEKVSKDDQFRIAGYDKASGTMDMRVYAAVRDVSGGKDFSDGIKNISEKNVKLHDSLQPSRYEAPQMFDTRQPDKITIFSSSKEESTVNTRSSYGVPLSDGIFRDSWKTDHPSGTNIVELRMGNTKTDRILNRSRIQLNKPDAAIINSSPILQKALMIDDDGMISAGLYGRLTQLGGPEGFAGGVELVRQGRLSFDNEKMGRAFLAVDVSNDGKSYSYGMPSTGGATEAQYKKIDVPFTLSEDGSNYARTLSDEKGKSILSRSKTNLNDKEAAVVASSITKITEDHKAARFSQLDFDPKKGTVNAAVYASISDIVKNKGLTLEQKSDFISGRPIRVDRTTQSRLESLGLSASELKKRYGYDVSTKTLGPKGAEYLAALNKEKNIVSGVVQSVKNQDAYGHKMHSAGLTRKGGRVFFGQTEVGEEEVVRTVVAGGQRNGHGKGIGQKNISKFDIVYPDKIDTRSGRRRTKLPDELPPNDGTEIPPIPPNKNHPPSPTDFPDKKQPPSPAGKHYPLGAHEEDTTNGGNDDRKKGGRNKKGRMVYSKGKLIKIANMERRVLKTGVMVLIPYMLGKINDPQADLNPGEGVNKMYSATMTAYEMFGIHIVRRAKNTVNRPLEADMEAIFANYRGYLIKSIEDLGGKIPAGLTGKNLEAYANEAIRKLNHQKGLIPPDKLKKLTNLYKELARMGRDPFSTYINHLNQLLIANGAKAAPVSLRGMDLQAFAQKQLMELYKHRGSFTKEQFKNLEAIYKQFFKLGKGTAFKEVRRVRLLSNFRFVFNTIVKQFQKHGSLAGEGLANVLQMSRYALMAIKATLRVIKGAAQLARIAAKTALKAAILAATGVGKLAEAHAATSAFAAGVMNVSGNILNGLNTVQRGANKVGRAGGRVRSWFRDPFGIKSRTRNAVNRLKSKVKDKLKDVVKKTWRRLTSRFKVLGKFDKFMRKGLGGASKVGKVLGKIGKVFSNIFNAVGMIVHTAINIVLIILTIFIFIAIIHSLFMMLISSITGIFDFMNSDEDVQKACIQRLNELYSEDMSISSELMSNGYILDGVSYNTVKDDDVYAQKKEDIETDKEFSSTTSNFAEILSMTLVRFNYDLDGTIVDKIFGTRKKKILSYVEGMYYASHNVNVTKWSESTWIDSDNDGKVDKEYRENHAKIVYTTYYFNQIFDLAESTDRKHKTETMVDAESYIPDYADATMEEIENAAYVYMRSAGFSSNGAAGTIAAIETMSGFDPTQNSNGYGIGCWGALDRASLMTWCNTQKYDDKDLDGQIRYLVHDMVSNASIASVVRDDNITAREAAQVVAIKYLNIKKIKSPTPETETATK